MERLPVAEWDLVVETNLRGVFLSNQAVLPAMLAQRRGVIVNLSSTSGKRGLADDAAYCASKFGVIGFSESLAEEVGPRGIRVQVVLPGPVDTPFWDQNGPLPKPARILPPGAGGRPRRLPGFAPRRHVRGSADGRGLPESTGNRERRSDTR